MDLHTIAVGIVGVLMGIALTVYVAAMQFARDGEPADERRAERDRAAVQRIEREKKEGGRE